MFDSYVSLPEDMWEGSKPIMWWYRQHRHPLGNESPCFYPMNVIGLVLSVLSHYVTVKWLASHSPITLLDKLLGIFP